jgi:hypothetical protein
MYSDTDIDAAVAAGVISRDAAAALRAHVASARTTPAVDEEHFRLVSGFNDIFVSIASVLLLVAVAWLGGDIVPWLGSAAVAAVAWGLAEYFTRQRRMALPSILLLLAFVGGVFGAASTGLLGVNANLGPNPSPVSALFLALSGAIAAGVAWLHWRRFHVPITIAAGAAAAAATLFGLLLAAFPAMETLWVPVLFACGIATFALAMWWDISDRERRTRRSDVAFWLHLLAAPMLVHPVFYSLGILENHATMATAAIVLVLYVLMGLIALAIDRRALMVSSLAYVLFALSTLFRELGAIGINVALTALVIGSALLLLSAFWHSARAFAVGLLPGAWQAKLPALGDRPAVGPAQAI